MFAKRFQHLQSIERHRIVMPPHKMRLNRLEKPQPWPDWLLYEMRLEMPLEKIQQYPDYPPFYEHLAEFISQPVDRIVVGAGIEEFARSLFMICADPGDAVAVAPWPSCAMFEVYARVFGLRFVKCLAVPGGNATDMLDSMDLSGVRLLWLVNPGQPVETMLWPDNLIWQVAAACRANDCILAIDEAYYGFGAPSAMSLVDDFDNVVVLRTFSKAFGCAGLRVGYAVAQEPIKRALDAVRQSGEVSSLSMWVASKLLRNYGAVCDSVSHVLDGRDWLGHELAERGIRAWGRWANQSLVEVKNAPAVADALAANGVLVKCFSEPPLPNHLLVTCGPRPMMKKFLEAFLEATR